MRDYVENELKMKMAEEQVAMMSQPISPFDQASEALYAEERALNEVLDRLVTELKVVLHPAFLTSTVHAPDPNRGADVEPHSQVVGLMRDRAEGFNSARRRLQDIIHAIDL